MSENNLELFFNKNKIKKENRKFPVTASLCDEEGKALEWEFKKIDVKESEEIRKDCFIEKPSVKRGKVDVEFDTDLYARRIVTASCIMPNLNNAELQDSYGVRTPEDLVLKMVDTIGEWTALQKFVMDLNGINESLADKVEEAKN